MPILLPVTNSYHSWSRRKERMTVKKDFVINLNKRDARLVNVCLWWMYVSWCVTSKLFYSISEHWTPDLLITRQTCNRATGRIFVVLYVASINEFFFFSQMNMPHKKPLCFKVHTSNLVWSHTSQQEFASRESWFFPFLSSFPSWMDLDTTITLLLDGTVFFW